MSLFSRDKAEAIARSMEDTGPVAGGGGNALLRQPSVRSQVLGALPSEIAFDVVRLVRRTKVLRRRLLRWTEGAVVEAERHALTESGRRAAADILGQRADAAGLGRSRGGAATRGPNQGSPEGRSHDTKRRWLVHSELWSIAPVIRRLDIVLRTMLREAGVATADLGDPVGEDEGLRSSFRASSGPGIAGAAGRGSTSAFAEDAMERAVQAATDSAGHSAGLIARAVWHSARAVDGFDRLGTCGLGEGRFEKSSDAEGDGEDASGGIAAGGKWRGHHGGARPPVVDDDLRAALQHKQPRRVLGYDAVRGGRALRCKAVLRP